MSMRPVLAHTVMSGYVRSGLAQLNRTNKSTSLIHNPEQGCALALFEVSEAGSGPGCDTRVRAGDVLPEELV